MCSLRLGRVRSIKDIQVRIAELARGKQPGEWIVTMPIGDPPYYFDVPDILGGKALADAAGARRCRAQQSGLHPRDLGLLARHVAARLLRQHRGAQARRHHPRHGLASRRRSTIQKDANGDPTGVFIEQEMQPLAEMIWFREATQFSHADRLRALPQSAKAYHGFGTTSIFEGHGAATELLRVYKQAHRDGTLTMRATLALSANWTAAGDAPLGPFVEAWAGWLGEPGFGDDWLKMSGLYVHIGRSPADDARASAAPYTGWAGFNSNHGLPREQVKELLLHCAKNDIRAGRDRRRRRARHARPLRRGRPRRFRSRAGAGWSATST